MKDVKSLSGGERSFTTLSLLLALQESIETPFRAMDEFDIYMDQQNRKMSLSLLVKSALEKNENRQYILITPNDLSDVQSHPKVQIQKLHPPKRGQRTIEQ